MDVKLNVTGDASGGVAAMEDMGSAVGKSVVIWQEMANVAKVAGKAVVDFLVDSTKKYAESERNVRQLARASGEYSEALQQQAQALSELYAVDDDLIMQSETLLAQWGGAAAASKEAEIAALNLASAMGTDLNSATQALIRNVESGGTGLAKMGIAFEATGDKGKDLQLAIAAINAKLGGAAKSDADSLIGRTHSAQLAFEDLQKSIGGMMATALDKTGALEFITEKIRQMTIGAEVLAAVLPKLPGFLGGVVRGNIDESTALADLKQTAIDAYMRPSAAGALPGMGTVTGATNMGRKEAGKADVQAHSDLVEAHDNLYAHEEESAAHTFTKIEKLRLDMAKSSADAAQTESKRLEEQIAQQAKDEARVEEKAQQDMLDRTAKKAKQAQAAGDAIGAAMVNALADQLSKLAEGGEFDAALFISEILAAAVGVAGTVIGTAFGQPAVGAAIGNLAAMGIRAGGSAISKGNRSNGPRTYHDGGWVAAPRHHSGAWINPDEQRAILQTGERVLSRAEVHHMGGPSGVDSAAKGAGRPIYIQAIDSKSMADTFSDRGGDGLKQALRRGHGALPGLLGRDPR